MTKPSDAAAATSHRRLPVHQRRHKVAPENRKRVSTACNNCNVRRIRCSGEKPCNQCRSGSRECQYPVPVDKVAIPRPEFEELQARCARLEQCLERALPDPLQRQNLLAEASVDTIPGRPLFVDMGDDSTSTEGRLLSDTDGTTRYLGSTSGATFLDLVKEFMITVSPLAWPMLNGAETYFLGSLGRYQSFDSRPLTVEVEASASWLPSKTELAVMMARLRYFIQDGSGEFKSGGIYYWGDLDPSFSDLEPVAEMADPPSLRIVATTQVGIALAHRLETARSSENNNQVSEVYFSRAAALLGSLVNPNESTVYDIPVLALMSFYLIEMNRRDCAYMYVGLGVRIAIMHGVHRGCIPDECGKRAFWTLYVLDRWLSCLMGRPPNIPDNAIRLPMPYRVIGMPSPAGLTAHVELSRISSYIVGDVYSIAPDAKHRTDPAQKIDHALWLLANFSAGLPPELRILDSRPSNDRAGCELHMFYYQLVILTLRPLFFVTVKKTVAERYAGGNQEMHHSQTHTSRIERCVSAARSNLRLGRWVRNLTPSRKLLLSDLHNVFNAAIILILYQLLVDSVQQQDALDILFVIECFDIEVFGNNDYHMDCSRVLRDLNTLVRRMRNRDAEKYAQVGGIGGNNSLLATTASQLHQDHQKNKQHHPPCMTATAYDVGFILNDADGDGDGPSGPSFSTIRAPVLDNAQAALVNNATHAALHEELSGWMGQDDFQLYTQSIESWKIPSG